MNRKIIAATLGIVSMGSCAIPTLASTKVKAVAQSAQQAGTIRPYYYYKLDYKKKSLTVQFHYSNGTDTKHTYKEGSSPYNNHKKTMDTQFHKISNGQGDDFLDAAYKKTRDRKGTYVMIDNKGKWNGSFTYKVPHSKRGYAWIQFDDKNRITYYAANGAKQKIKVATNPMDEFPRGDLRDPRANNLH